MKLKVKLLTIGILALLLCATVPMATTARLQTPPPRQIVLNDEIYSDVDAVLNYLYVSGSRLPGHGFLWQDGENANGLLICSGLIPGAHYQVGHSIDYSGSALWVPNPQLCQADSHGNLRVNIVIRWVDVGTLKEDASSEVFSAFFVNRREA